MLDLVASPALGHLDQRVAFVRGGAEGFAMGAAIERTPAAVRRWRPDVLHGWLLQGNMLAAVLKGVVPSARVVTSERNLGHALTGSKRVLERLAAAIEDVATANSEAVRAAAVQRVPARAARMVVIRPGVAPLPRPDRTVPSDVVMVGRLHGVKDHRTALRAWREVLAHQGEARLSIVGDGPERGRLEQLARSLRIGGRVSFHGDTDPAPHLYGAHVFLSSSLAEGFSRALIEALGAGLPAVCTEVGGVEELPAAAVLRAPAGDADALAAGLVTLLGDAVRRERAASAARAAADAYDPATCHLAYAALYDRLVTGAGVLGGGRLRD